MAGAVRPRCKYLSDGNYEEAIIAFTAAIEIDPKRAEAYAGLSDLYRAVGDDDMFRRTLQKGYDATADMVLYDKLKSSSQFYMRYGFSFFNQLKPEQRKFISDLVDVIINGDKDSAWEMLENTPWEENHTTLYTECDQVRIGVNSETNRIEIRPRNGIGYYCSAGKTADDWTWRNYGTGACENWTWNGEHSLYSESWFQARIDRINFNGQMVDGLLDGRIYITGTQTYLDDIDEHENVKTQSLNTTKEYDRGSLLPITDERDRLDGVFNASYSKEDVESIKWGD